MKDLVKTTVGLLIRCIVHRDMPEVLRIEQASRDPSWREEDFLRCMRQRNCIGMVAEQDEKVIGFIIYELHKTKLYLLNFAIHPERRRQGVGAQMVAKLMSKLAISRRTRIVANVRETNLNAQLFFRSVGFRATGVERAFFDDSGEDAFVMEYQLAETEAKTETAFSPANRLAQ